MPPRFIADEMNGDLSKWLRMMGFDCIYITGENLDNKLLDIALKEDRILLTGDRELYRKTIRRGGKAIYTPGTSLEDKFKEIRGRIDLKQWVGKLPYRCSQCNNILKKVETEKLDNIPPSVRKRFKYVWFCDKCGKAYWEGSHWVNIISKINILLNEKIQ